MPNEMKKTYAAQMEASRCGDLMMRTRALPGDNMADKVEYAIRAGEKAMSIQMPNGEVLEKADEAYNYLRNIIAGALSAADVANKSALQDKDAHIARLQEANLILQSEKNKLQQKIDQSESEINRLQARISNLSSEATLQADAISALKEHVSLLNQQLANAPKIEDFINSLNERLANRECIEDSHIKQ